MSLCGQWLHWPVWNVPRGTWFNRATETARDLLRRAGEAMGDPNATAVARSNAEVDAERIIQFPIFLRASSAISAAPWLHFIFWMMRFFAVRILRGL
jgi:hypothetical protein